MILPSYFLLVTIIILASCTSSTSAFSHCRSFLKRPRHFSRMSSTKTTPADPLEILDLPGPILLGSASFTRKLILKEMGVSFVKCVRPIDEKNLGDRSKDAPADLVLTLAKAKMDHLVKEIQAGNCKDELPHDGSEWIVLTGDQVVTCNGKILEKPETIDEAREFVATYRTHPPSTVGSCVLTHIPSGIQVSGVDTATIYFSNSIPADLVDRLVELGEPILSCAGGLMIEHPLTKEHLERIEGTEDSVMGLSKDLVLRLLQELKTKLDENK
jgi:septum formation protein